MAQQVEEGARRELARGTIELAVLAALKEHPRYGYELLRLLDGRPDGPPGIKEGTVYPVLHRLEDGGCVASFWEAEGRSNPRKYYRLTPEGRERLAGLRVEWERLVEGMARLLGGEEA